ncbi:MAG: ribosome hibernation-promoting factor, HPF/YfiA family [Paracoccaceae bacterium]
MRYQITGKQIDVGEALQGHVRSEIDAMLSKYSGRPTDATVVFSRSGHEHVCETVIHLSTGLTAQATGRSAEIYAALDASVERIDKQLRRYKRRLKDHQASRAVPVELTGAGAYVLASRDGDEEGEPDGIQSMIIAETETQVPSLSVSEAVMQMELAHAPVLIFRKEGRGINVVYRREDGNVGWIDPHDTSS